MRDHDNFQWMVSISDETFTKGSKSDIIELKDPSTNQNRQYIQAGTNLLEIQSLESDFSSFIVGRHVVKDGNLYVMNRVDPLFWFFHHYNSTETIKQWKPVDQIIDGLPAPVQKALDQKQLPHLFQVLNNEAMGDEPFYKFVPERALKWLQKKHLRILQCVKQQEQAKRERNKEKLAKSRKGGGSVSSSFYIPDQDPVSAAPQTDPTIISDADLQQLMLDSAHILLSYLPSDWSNPLLDHLSLSELQAKTTTKAKPAAVETKVQVVSPDKAKEQPIVVKPKKKVVEAQTIGNKRLAKVNTKGMKSLASFFGAPKKKKKVQ